MPRVDVSFLTGATSMRAALKFAVKNQVSLAGLTKPFFGQASKGIRWMPWRTKAMKDVVSCDKPRGAASRLRSGDFRMGQPRTGNAVRSVSESNRRREANEGK